MEAYSSARFWPKDDSTIIGSVHVKVAPTVSSVDSSSPHATSSQGHYARIDGVVERVDALLRSRIAGLEELSIQIEGGGRNSCVT